MKLKDLKKEGWLRVSKKEENEEVSQSDIDEMFYCYFSNMAKSQNKITNEFALERTKNTNFEDVFKRRNDRNIVCFEDSLTIVIIKNCMLNYEKQLIDIVVFEDYFKHHAIIDLTNNKYYNNFQIRNIGLLETSEIIKLLETKIDKIYLNKITYIFLYENYLYIKDIDNNFLIYDYKNKKYYFNCEVSSLGPIKKVIYNYWKKQ